MITVRFSDRRELVLPESLGRTLGLRDGDRIEVERHNDVLELRRHEAMSSSGPLTELSEIVSSSRPVGSVDVESIMDKHGYEQIYARSGL
jgi:bifunctional DNA-binding transcriptional regulator/antitoxin component of YhaV-PrlF toxin-antitoxin module